MTKYFFHANAKEKKTGELRFILNYNKIFFAVLSFNNLIIVLNS
jgi:hypothetical protein